MAVDLNAEAPLALNVYSAPYAEEGVTKWVVYPDSDQGVITAATLARGTVPEGGMHFGDEDEWYYGVDVTDFLATVDAEGD